MKNNELMEVGKEYAKKQKSLCELDETENTPIRGFEGRNKSLTRQDMSRYIREARANMDLPEIDISDPVQVTDRMNWYLDRCEANGNKPTLVGLCNSLGIDRKTLYRWGAGIDRLTTHQKIIVKYKNLLEELWETEMVEGKINPIVGIFIGKNHFGYADKQEVVLTPNNPYGEQKTNAELEERYLESVVDEET